MLTIKEIKEKHEKLRKLDSKRFFKSNYYKIFGSDTHQYKFNLCLPEKDINNFERKYSISLPIDYKEFLNQIGNGGSGPAYGLLPLESWNIELEIADNKFLSTQFPHKDKWNLAKDFDTDDDDYTETEEFENWEDEYFSNKHITGSIRICHYGCAIYFILIVAGENAGEIWIDDRASDGGVYPAKSDVDDRTLKFLEWYEEWLTESIDNYSTNTKF